jgi:hypothetical protein
MNLDNPTLNSPGEEHNLHNLTIAVSPGKGSCQLIEKNSNIII